jgi:Txe/YoeB family toxin of Txe-Axe toxin-antitoxin module
MLDYINNLLLKILGHTESMKTTFQRIKSNLIPIAILAAAAGAIQDLLTPLMVFGIKAGVAIVVLGLVILIIPEQSKLGIKIKDITDNWKTPLVVSLFILGLLVITASVVTEQSNEDSGILASKFPALATIQSSLLNIEKEIAETKKLVEVNIEVTNSVKEDTTEIKDMTIAINNDTTEIKKDTKETLQQGTKTLKNTEEIINNIRKNPFEELTSRGLRPNNNEDFVNSVKQSSEQEFKELMHIYKASNFNVLKEVDMPDAALMYNYNDDAEASNFFFIPSKARLLDILFAVKADYNRIRFISDLFNISIAEVTSPVANGYARMKYALGPFHYLDIITHPQIDMATGEDVDFSLISHRLKRDSNLTKKRGGYSPLHYVSVYGYLEYLEPLIASGLNINALSHAGYTPLTLAIESGNIEMANALISKGAKLTINKSIAVEVALIKGLAYNKPKTSNGMPNKFHSVNDNVYFKLLTRNSINSLPPEIYESVLSIYKKYFDYETYSKRQDSYKQYIQWLKANYAN